MAKRKQNSQNEKRKASRQQTKISSVILFRESEDEGWEEISEITTASRNGAGFTVSRECQVGRLVSLMMQMPRELRLYDHDEDVYLMLGVVQNCYETTLKERRVFHVGVAFIGKEIPDSFKENPSQCYRILGMTPEGLWKSVESTKQFKSRKQSRFWRRFNVTVAPRDWEKRTRTKVDVVSRDISAGGMSVWGPLDAYIGEKVKISCQEHDFYAIEIVRNRTENEADENKSSVHFEFLGTEFPMEKIHASLPEPDGEEPQIIDGSSETSFPSDTKIGEIVKF